MYKSKCFHRFTVGVLAMLLPFAAATGASGEDSWQFEGDLYIWGAAIGGETEAGDDFDMSFGDILDNLDMTFMGALQARKGKWSLLADVIYMDLSNGMSSTAKQINRPVRADLDVGLKSWVITGAAGYTVIQTDSTRLDLLAGGRYLDLKADLDFKISAEHGGPWQQKVTDSEYFLDGIVGVRGVTRLSDKWYLSYYADVGSGDTDLTWQVLAGFNYRFDKVDAGFGYRYLKWEFDDGGVLNDLDINGPYAGVRFKF